MPVVPGTKVAKWKATKRLGKGSFGELWLGEEDKSRIKVAIKFEKYDNESELEYQKYLEIGPSEYVPKVYKFLRVPGTEYQAIVMELLFKSLENLLDICDRTFTLKTTLQLATNMITIIQFVHSKGIIHRDIKPDNFMFGRKDAGKDKQLMVIDFGLAKTYFEHGRHINYTAGKPIGTCRYMSANSHDGNQQSRRDDLESIGYCLIYFLNGKLPWSGIEADSTKTRMKIVGDMKRNTPPEKLMEGHPVEFAQYLKYARGLKFMENPDYDHLRELFTTCAERHNITIDTSYDWDDRIESLDSDPKIKPETKSNMKQRSNTVKQKSLD